MPDSEEWINELTDAVVSHVSASGYFERVNQHEAVPEPGSGLTAAVWPLNMRAIQLSGLDSSSIAVVMQIRIYSNLYQEPRDQIDPQVLKAASFLMRQYHDDFDFGGLTIGSITVRNVDLLGMVGEPLRAVTGYLEIGENTVYRIVDIFVPVILNDVWPQGGV